MFPRLATTSIYDSPAMDVGVVMIGPWGNQEFKIACSDIHDALEWTRLNDIHEGLEFVAQETSPPDIILLAQPRPGYYRQEDIDRMQALSPLTRIVIVAGSWCEGELRTGKPVQGVFRLYWYELSPWWTTALSSLDEGLCPPWSMPLGTLRHTTPLADRPGSATPWGTKTKWIAVSADDPAVFRTLEASLPSYGMSATRLQAETRIPTNERFSGAIWDGGQLGSKEMQRLNEFCKQVYEHDCNVVALLDFPRAEHFQQVKEAGATCILAKPYLLADLVDLLRKPTLH